jgi:hypothetical protein
MSILFLFEFYFLFILYFELNKFTYRIIVFIVFNLEIWTEDITMGSNIVSLFNDDE